MKKPTKQEIKNIIAKGHEHVIFACFYTRSGHEEVSILTGASKDDARPIADALLVLASKNATRAAKRKGGA